MQTYANSLKTHYKETYFYIDTYNDFLKYFKENDKKEYQRLLKKYCDFIFANLANIDDHLKQTELQINYNFNVVVISNKRPVQMPLVSILDVFTPNIL